MARKKKSAGSKVAIFWLLIMPSMIVFGPTALLVLAGMVPTIVAWMVDRTQNKYSAYCVGCMNLAGTVPFALKLWTGTNDLTEAVHILGDPLTLLGMYSAASFGWILYFIVPAIVENMVSLSTDSYVKKLDVRRKELVEEWGEEVAGMQDQPVISDDEMAMDRKK